MPALGLSAQNIKLRHGVTAKPVQLTHRQDYGAFEVVGEAVEFEGSAAEASELVPEAFLAEGLLFSDGKREGGGDLHDVADFIAQDQGERRAGVAVDFDGDGPLEARLIAVKAGAEAAVEFGVVGFPEPVADVDAGEVDVAVAEGERREHGRAGTRFLGGDFVEAAAFLLFLGMRGIEDDPVAGLGGSFKAHRDAAVVDTFDATEIDTAFLAKAGVNKLLVVYAAKPAGIKAARETHFEGVAVGVG